MISTWKLQATRMPNEVALSPFGALIHPANGNQQKAKWFENSLGFQSPLSRLRVEGETTANSCRSSFRTIRRQNRKQKRSLRNYLVERSTAFANVEASFDTLLPSSISRQRRRMARSALRFLKHQGIEVGTQPSNGNWRPLAGRAYRLRATERDSSASRRGTDNDHEQARAVPDETPGTIR